MKMENKQLDSTKIKNRASKCKQSPTVPIESQEIFKHRTNIKELMLWSNATPIRRYGDMGYMCCYCNDYYPKPKDLKEHTIQTHKDVRNVYFMKLNMDGLVVRLDITSLQCKICNKNLHTIEDLMKHLKDVHHKTIYTDIKSHITPLKFVTDTLQCCICAKSFDKFKMLLEHMNLHYRNYICKVCDAGFAYNSSLRTHMHVHNTGTFKCDHCSDIFDTNAKKRAHKRATHSIKPNVHKCGYCNEAFAVYRLKEAHLVSMHGFKVPTSKCQACEKVFTNRQALSLHIKRDHLLERRHKCLECDMRFFKTTDLKDHMVKHTGLRSYKCTVCLKAFGRAKTLKQHMKIHDDVRRFKCEHCGQAFVQKCSWRGHMRAKHEEIV